MRGALVALALILAPTLPLAFSYPAGLERVRDWWLRGVCLAAILVVPPFLAPIAAWWAWRWPLREKPWRLVPALVVWGGLAGAWAVLVALPPGWWPWVALGWVSYGIVLVAHMVWRASRQGWRGFGQRQGAGLMGTPVMEALYLALTAPFWPVWAYPVLALGLWLSCSWAAFLALGMGAAVYYWPF